MITGALYRLTWLDVVNEEMDRDVPAEEANFILWNLTAFPFASVETVRRQIREQREAHPERKSGSTPTAAPSKSSRW